MDQWTAFAWGMLGFTASELAAGYLHYRWTDALPDRYRRASFWAVCVVLGAVVGFLIVAIAPDKPTQAIALGGALPLIIHRAHRMRRNAAQERA